MSKSIKSEVIETISDLTKISKEKIHYDQNFSEVGLDSLVMVEIIFVIERKYNINIPQDSFGKIQTVGNLIELIEEQVKVQHPRAKNKKK